MVLTDEQVKDLVDGFKAFLMGTMAENTAESYALDSKHIMAMCGNDTANLTKANIRKFVEYGGHDERSAPSTQVRHRAAMRAFFKYMANERRDLGVDENICNGIRTQRLGRRIPECLSVDEINSILEASGAEMTHIAIRNRTLLEVMYAAGLRVDEVMHIRIGDVTLGEKTGRIRIVGKGNKERMTIIGQRAMRWLNEYLEYHRSFLTGEKGLNALLFASVTGKTLTKVTVWRMLKKAAVNAGIEPSKIHPHVLRHSFATHMLNGGANLMVIKELLGHASIATTQIYLTVSDRDKADAYMKAFPKLG